jgi:hypothetical protein
MTEKQAIDIIKLSLPSGDTAGIDKVAKSVLQYAITKASRLRGTDFNREYLPGTLTNTKQEYILGTELFGSQSKVWNISEMWFTDTTGRIVEILGLDDFNVRAAGGKSTGRPTIGTVHSKTRKLRLYPIPDSAYPFEAYVTSKISALNDIDEIYHDVIVDIAGLMIQAASDPNVKLKLVQEGLKDLLLDSGSGWTGSTMLIDKPLSRGQRFRKTADSSNLGAE